MRAVRLVAAAMQTAEFDPERLEARAAEGGTTLTELADTLSRDHDVPFKTAHQIAARVLQSLNENPAADLQSVLAAMCLQYVGRTLPYTRDDLARILSPRHFVEVRRTHGGPAPEETERALGESQQLLERDHTWLTDRRRAASASEGRLRERTAAL